MSTKNCTIGNRTRDLPAFSAVPQPCTPNYIKHEQKFHSKCRHWNTESSVVFTVTFCNVIITNSDRSHSYWQNSNCQTITYTLDAFRKKTVILQRHCTGKCLPSGFNQMFIWQTVKLLIGPSHFFGHGAWLRFGARSLTSRKRRSWFGRWGDLRKLTKDILIKRN